MLTLALLLCAAADPLPVPADSLAVVQVRGLGHVRTQLAGLAAAVSPQRADEFAFHFDALLMADAWAIDPTRRGWLAVLPTADGVTWSAWLPTTNSDRFRAAAATTVPHLHLLDRPGYVVVTPHEPTAKLLAADPKPLPAVALGDAADVFFGSDLGLFVNLPAVQTRYGGVLAGTRLLLPAMLTGGAFGLPKFDARQAAQIAAVADGVIQAVADSSGFAVGVNVGPGGVTVETALSVRPNTASAKVLAGENPHSLALLDSLPGGHSAYAAGRFGAELAKRLRVAFLEVATADDGMYAAHGWATAGASPGPVLEVCRPAHPEKWLASLRSAYDRADAGTAVQNVPLKQRPALTRSAVEYRGRAFDRLALAFDLPVATAAIADEGIRQAAHVTIKSLVGERAEQWLTTDASHGLRVAAADWPTARTLVDGFLGDGAKAKDDAMVRAIRKRLPAEATAVVLLDAAAVTCRVGGLVKGAVEELPAFPGLELPTFVAPTGRSPLLGVAVVTTPAGARAMFVLPADALRAAVAAVKTGS